MIHRNVLVPMKNRHGDIVNVQYPAYLYGMMIANQIKKQDKRHNLYLVCGGVGTGKSTFVKGMAALEAKFSNVELTLDDFHWSMDSVINAMDSDKNKLKPIIADEWIQSGGSRGFALTNIGNKLKIGFVTKRMKMNSYYLLVDQLKEFPEKLIEMADALFIVNNIGLERGFVDAYTDKMNIYFLWNGLKNMGKNWMSSEIRKIKPDAIIRFPDYSDLFVDEDEFDKRKIEETRQNEDESIKDKKTIAVERAIIKFSENGLSQSKIAEIVGYSQQHIARIIKNTHTHQLYLHDKCVIRNKH